MFKEYETKPCTIKAMQWFEKEHLARCQNKYGETPDPLTRVYYRYWPDPSDPPTPMIKTLEGEMVVSEGDYIIIGLEGEYYCCKPSIFEKKYQLKESQ